METKKKILFIHLINFNYKIQQKRRIDGIGNNKTKKKKKKEEEKTPHNMKHGTSR